MSELTISRTQSSAMRLTQGEVYRALSNIPDRAQSEIIHSLDCLIAQIIGWISLKNKSKSFNYGSIFISDKIKEIDVFLNAEKKYIENNILKYSDMAEHISWLGMIYTIDAATPPNIKAIAGRGRLVSDRNIPNRVHAFVMRLQSSILDIISRSILNKWKSDQINSALYSLIKSESIKKPHRYKLAALPLAEAEQKNFGVALGFPSTQRQPYGALILDNERWQLAVELFRDQMNWDSRSPGLTIGRGKFAMESERFILGEISSSIATGKIEAAMLNGDSVESMIWISVLDDRNEKEEDGNPDYDCRGRDGLTMEEIKEKYGKFIAPPLHYNCRCDLIPEIKEWKSLAGEILYADAAVSDRVVSVDGDIYRPGVPTFSDWVNF